MSDIVHLIPEGATPGGEDLSIVIPALNEKLTIGEFVDWCKQGLASADVRGQILIVDSSTDDTPEIALRHGAEVLRTPPRGLGRAYIDAIPDIRGQWIVMGDADLTYDFRELAPFVEEFRKGADFIMGSRFSGSIEAGAMPGLHRYFGTPLTTWLLNRIYHSRYSDIHCGMRGLTRASLAKINLRSQSWEYASEMVLKAARLELVTAEVPVKFYKDRAGRVSHHKRMGWLSPWIAGWLNLKAMLVYTPDSFLLKPGMIIMALGLILSFSLVNGPFRIGNVVFSLYWMLLGVTLTTLGYSCLQIGVLSRMMHGLRPGIVRQVQRVLGYDRGMILAALSTLTGLCLTAVLVWRYVQQGLKLESLSYSAILGLLLIILGFQTFGFTLLMEMAQRVMPKPDGREFVIITRSPLRISLGGGGTDLPSYYQKHSGFLIAAAIDKYVYINVHQRFVQNFLLKYSHMEEAATIDEIKHPIIREALRMVEIEQRNLEITSMADIPAGTGLGSSGSFTTALLKALHAFKKNLVHPEELAAQACAIELEKLGEPIGKQDQYIAAFGGVTRFEFLPDGQVKAKPLDISDETLFSLEDDLLLFFTGYSRSASAILKEQDDKSKEADQTMTENLHFIKELGERSRLALEGGDLREFARLMDVHWQRKKERSAAMSNAYINEWYDCAMANGALGGKVIGAGGGGFLMFYAEDKAGLRHAMRAQGLAEVRFRFDFEGTKVLNQ